MLDVFHSISNIRGLIWGSKTLIKINNQCLKPLRLGGFCLVGFKDIGYFIESIL